MCLKFQFCIPYDGSSDRRHVVWFRCFDWLFCFVYIVHAVRYDSVVTKIRWMVVSKTAHSLMMGHYGAKHVAVCVLKHYYSSYNKTN